ncbi:MAG: nucleoside deaminase [Phycisphaerales bacterium]|nr:nucleoside deaminase [Phycisphaerales bacterium]
MHDDDRFMQAAIDAARRGLALGQSPFGAAIFRGDDLVFAGHNQVWLRGDPTAHAEVVAIGGAARALARIELSGCRLYSTCEPCPMCAAAIHWARLDAVAYGATIADAAAAGFNELHVSIGDLYERGGSRVRVAAGVAREACAALFAEWMADQKRRAY